jgi:DNA-binding GntR family transcriptional regulator
MKTKDAIAANGPVSTRAARIYRMLLQSIMAGELPPGHRLDENVLAERFGVSRTPVREALRELGARKLIDLIPRQGGFVASLGMESLADMLDAECELESLCARIASQRMQTLERIRLQEVHEQMRAALERGALRQFYDLNDEFHAVVLAGAHNETLKEAARDLRFRLSPLRRTGRDAETIIERAYQEHSAVLAAILEHRPADAFDAMHAHNTRVNTKTLLHYRRKEDNGPAAFAPAA